MSGVMSSYTGSDGQLGVLVIDDLRIRFGKFFKYCLPPCLPVGVRALRLVQGDFAYRLVAAPTGWQKNDRGQQVKTSEGSDELWR
jgi:hypothetical protein